MGTFFGGQKENGQQAIVPFHNPLSVVRSLLSVVRSPLSYKYLLLFGKM